MATITDIKRRIQELAPAPFQEFCDTLISKNWYGVVHGYGMKAGTGNTTIGNPDTYFRKENGKYVFVAYTIQQTSIYTKLKEDIEKCLDSSKTGLEISEIDEIICCHTSSNLSAGDDKRLHDYCENYGISLTIWGIDEIANQVHNRYRSMAKDFLGLSIDTNQILFIDDFIRQSDANGMSAPLSTTFQYREKEKKDIINCLETDSVIIITGKPGVGKTRLVLETIQIFANSKDCKVLCVKNNNLGLYDDLVAATETVGSYVFFVDDANELAELDQILAYTIRKPYGYDVKVIVTVRDYAKLEVITSVKNYTIPKIIEISSFSDDEIKGFLNENLKIKNEHYIKQIIRIAEGNPRMAYMAGKLAVEKQNLTAIKDVSQLYDSYYGKYVNKTLGQDRNLCFTVGVLSVINAVMLNNMEHLQQLLDSYGISGEEFNNKINQLSSLEVVEIHHHKVAALTDQCLANYMLYYVFFKRKIMPLSDVIEIGYKYFYNGIIRAINIIFNLFTSAETKDYCREQILIAWDNLKKEKHPSYEKFIQDFHVFRPEESFSMVQKRIENIENGKFNVVNESILSFLSGYQNSEYLNYVMELLLKYASKSSKSIVSSFKWLKNSYGIEISDFKYDYLTQRKISTFLLKASSNDNNFAMEIGFHWAEYSLKFSFESVEMRRGDTITLYKFNLKYSEGLLKYRKACWEILLLLSAKSEWKEKIILFLDMYSRNFRNELNKDIIENDFVYIKSLLPILKCNKISLLKVVRRILIPAKKLGVSYDEKWDEIFIGEKWKLYQLLSNNYIFSGLEYNEYEKSKKNNIVEYGKKLSESDIQILVQNVNSILSEVLIKQDSYYINQGLELLIQQFDNDHMQKFLKAFIEFGNNISIKPSIVLNPLNQNNNPITVLTMLKGAIFPQKNEWIFGFFESLLEEQVDEEMLEEFFAFITSETDSNITCSSYRSLRVLDKFLKIQSDIYPKISDLIYKKRHYNSFIVIIYFELLFHNGIYSPEELLRLYKNDINLLQDIYFFMIKEDSNTDFDGTFLANFLSIDETWLERYSDYLWENIENDITNDNYRNNILWKSKDFIKYFDYMFYNFPKEESYRRIISSPFKNILTDVREDDTVKQHQQEWLTNIIKKNAFNDWIYIIFEFVCELDDDIKRKAIKVFLENNSDIEAFNKLSLLPSYWSGDGSLVPGYQQQIDFLKSLYPFSEGISFLDHRLAIKSKIELLQERIKKEEVEVIYKKLVM